MTYKPPAGQCRSVSSDTGDGGGTLATDNLPNQDTVNTPDGLPSEAALTSNNPAESAVDPQVATSQPDDVPAVGPVPEDGPDVDPRNRANRENAKKSSGAKTDAGRAASSRNAAKHCLFAADITKYFRSEEESQRYQRFVDGIVNDLHPVGDFETVLARRAADIQFRLEMLRTAEFKVYSGAGIVKGTMEGYLFNHRDPISLVSLYDARFQRSFKNTMEELRSAQKARRDQELHALEQLKGIALSHIQQNATFDPAKFGFVISRDLVFNQAHFASVKKLAQFAAGNGVVEKKVVDYVAQVPPKAA
jgi:hypothetical protein